MNDIDLLEHGGGNFSLVHHGIRVLLPDPRSMDFQSVLMALGLRYVAGTPDDIPAWQVDHVFRRWAAAWDLPEFNSARRLAYLVDHYRSALVYDLRTHVNGADLGELWRERRWQTLLDIIDHLPGHSWYSAAVAEDKEHARLMAEAIAARKNEDGEEEEKPKGPRINTWTPELAMLTSLTDAVRRVEWAVFASQAGQKAGEAPKPLPRPQTALELEIKLAEHRLREARHKSLVARMLPHKAQSED